MDLLTPWAQKVGTRVDKRLEPIDKAKNPVAHAFLYGKSSKEMFRQKIKMRYAALMVMRFDGRLGFPGGQIECDETIEDGLNRELHEEILLDKKFFLDDSNYFFSCVQEDIVSHFYTKQFSETEIHEIETSALASRDWGGETLGILRVPVPIFGDGSKKNPLAKFLQHNFVSNSREQLIEALIETNIFSKQFMIKTWNLIPPSH